MSARKDFTWYAVLVDGTELDGYMDEWFLSKVNSEYPEQVVEFGLISKAGERVVRFLPDNLIIGNSKFSFKHDIHCEKVFEMKRRVKTTVGLGSDGSDMVELPTKYFVGYQDFLVTLDESDCSVGFYKR